MASCDGWCRFVCVMRIAVFVVASLLLPRGDDDLGGVVPGTDKMTA